jgi:hypothetical protein
MCPSVSLVLVMCEKSVSPESKLRYCEGKEPVLITEEVIYL